MISLTELLRFPKKQEETNCYVVFLSSFTNSYKRANYPKTGKICHLGRGNLIRSSLISCCKRGIAHLDMNSYLESWEIKTVDEIKRDPRYHKGMYCKRCIALAGFIISGGMLPNSNSGIQSSSSSTTTTGSLIANEPGEIRGNVEGLSGLPAIGASVIAENLKTGESTSVFVSLTGDYLINLPPGTYEITVSFPNGVTQVVDSFEITRGAAHEVNISYNE
jgi:hypothetical protein